MQQARLPGIRAPREEEGQRGPAPGQRERPVRLLAWWSRAKALRNREDSEDGTRENRACALDEFVERCASLEPRAAAQEATEVVTLFGEHLPARAVRRRPVLVGTLIFQQ